MTNINEIKERTCSRCRHAVPGGSLGYVCRRYPPEVVWTENPTPMSFHLQPEVSEYDRCGEWGETILYDTAKSLGKRELT